jgi:integral membrane protein (TIGR01906 family)
MKEQTLNYQNSKWMIFPRSVFALFILIIVLTLPLIIISSSASFYKHRLQESDCYLVMSEKDCTDLSINVLNYLKGKESLDSRYSDVEQSHFADVKNVLDFAKILVLGLSFFVLAYILLFLFLDKLEIWRTFKLAGLMTIIFFALILLMMMFSFEKVFFLFHGLLFPQGNWMFPFDSTIIVVFSEGFFVRAAFTSFLFSLGAGFLLLGSSFLGNIDENKIMKRESKSFNRKK